VDIRGISHHTDGVPEEAAARDMRVIREELHCTAVMLVGADTERQRAAARAALDAGLDVWVRPQPENPSAAERLEHLAATARMAEELRLEHPGRVTLMVGTEFSLTSPGMLPGADESVRLQFVLRPWLRRPFERRMRRRLGALLAAALDVARERFGGPVSYGAGAWEDVDWSGFDLAGVNLYRAGTDADADAYERHLDALLRGCGRPLVVTEFGCGAHDGADLRGAASFLAVNWFADPPRLRRGTARNEAVQAGYLDALLGLYRDRGVHGAFVFTFAMPDFPHSQDPARDLDAAGFGVVRTAEGDPASWEPKEAFHAVARRYRD
jgi:hypothetical protein